MKIKYLSAEDRRNLRQLRHMEEREKLPEILSEICKMPRSMQALWEYRKWLYMLTEEEMESYPELICAVSTIYVLDGNLQKAEKLAEKLPEDSLFGIVSRLLLPGADKMSFARQIKNADKNGWRPVLDMPITCGRPSILNGVWDFTPYGELLKNNKEKMEHYIDVLFGDQTPYIYEVALAEYLYWQDECYEALVLLIGVIPFLKNQRDMQLLFVALTLQTYIMVLSGQASSTVPMMENLREQIVHNEIEEYLPNVDALDAWAAMYDGDYQKVARWMREGAPDEYGKFCMLDLFRYFVKIRAYLIHGKYLAITALASRLLPLLESGQRYMDSCELHILWAMSDDAAGRKEDALNHVETALKLSEQYRYERLFADEGMRMLKLLKEYRKVRASKGKTAYLDKVIKMVEKTATLYPRYLKSQLPKLPALTEGEMRILWLLADFRTNSEIAEITGTTIDNVKKHCKNINAKLEVKNRHQAVQRAIEYGLLKGNI